MIRKSQALLIGTVAILLTAVIAFGSGWTLRQQVQELSIAGIVASESLPQPSERPSAPGNTQSDFAIYWDVWNLVHEEFYHTEPLDQKTMTYGAIRGMLHSLDDEYTTFQEPAAAERARESMRGTFEGIGILMRLVDGELIVARPLKKSPALKAGVQEQDVVVAVDGLPVATIIAGLDDAEALDALSRKIRGPRGSTVQLTIRRPSQTELLTVAIVRDVVPLTSVYANMLDEQVAYIQITEFREITPREFDEALRELLPQEPESLILDLRNNPGGLLVASQEVLGRFYQGVALYEEDSNGEVHAFDTIQGPGDVRVRRLPLVVLINEHSASASEIVAGALAERYPDTTVLGMQSFGKGSVQNVHRLRDGSSVRITIAHWFTPDKNEINEVGITPDYVVAPSDDATFAVPCVGTMLPPEGQKLCNDAQLLWGMRLLTEQEEPPPPTATPAALEGLPRLPPSG
jgi:carboxyl-terminal processing protease